MTRKPSLGFTSAILLFFIFYAAFLNLKGLPFFKQQNKMVGKIARELNGFTTDSQTIGQLGGFYTLLGWHFEAKENFDRLTLAPLMEREILGEALALPLVQADLKETGGLFRLELLLTDTKLTAALQPLRVESLLIDRIRAQEGPTENSTRIVLELKNKASFRLWGNEEKGELYLELSAP